LKKSKEHKTFPCRNGICGGSENCALRSYIEDAAYADELASTWKVLSDNCPIAGDLVRSYNDKLRRLKKNVTE